MTDGERMLQLAEAHIGEKYVNICVPKNNPNWKGPWDCAEFMSWLVFQVGGFLYGCIDNNGNPAITEAYTGAWQRDCQKLGRKVAQDVAAKTPGAVLLRYPPAPGTMGHIVVSDGKGGTVEAMGKAFGVRRGKVSGRHWDTGVLIPKFSYAAPAGNVVIKQPMFLYALGRPGMKASVISAIQQALREQGIDPGPNDGQYDAMTVAAVAAFQTLKGLIVDGEVGPQTAQRLKVELG
jgi:N-acetylmuramoyl-L-alanine amidase